jgi:enoyl-CoA hydratase
MPYVRIEKPIPNTSTIVIDRPERMNSMAFELVGPLHDAIDEVAADNDTTCVILTGAGKMFCAGADTKHDEPPPNIDGLTLTRIATRSMSILADLVPALQRMPQPVI